jgi:predicted ArsR family transcriptional regulator
MPPRTTGADGALDVDDVAAPVAARSLVSLLGAPRASIVDYLRRQGGATVAQLAAHLEVSEVATRRHLAVLEGDALVAAHTVPQGRGRPPARYALTQEADRLFPHSYDRLASDMMDYLADEFGRSGLRSFLRWRLEREVDHLRDAVTAEQLHDRLEQLAGALSEAGFAASVTPDDTGFTLTQDHCAIYDVAKDHPEICAYEAATFSKVLGRDVTLSRRETLAGGSPACVCSVAPRPQAPSGANHDQTNDHQATGATPPTSLPLISSSAQPGDQP